jgi:hypothetical protein
VHRTLCSDLACRQSSSRELWRSYQAMLAEGGRHSVIMSTRCALQTNSRLSCILTLDNECILSRVMQAAMIDFHDCLVLVGDVHEQEVAALRKCLVCSLLFSSKELENLITYGKVVSCLCVSSRGLIRWQRPESSSCEDGETSKNRSRCSLSDSLD